MYVNACDGSSSQCKQKFTDGDYNINSNIFILLQLYHSKSCLLTKELMLMLLFERILHHNRCDLVT